MRARAEIGFWGSFLRTFSIFVLAGIVILALVLQVIPRVMGGGSLTVLSGSMSPTINAGDVIAIRGVAEGDIRVGDIVTFQPYSDDPTLVTHRVVAMGVGPDEVTFTTQGDANTAADDPILAEQIVGVYMYRVPYVGYFLHLFSGLTFLPILIGAGLVIVALLLVFPPRRRPPRTDAVPGSRRAYREEQRSS